LFFNNVTRACHGYREQGLLEKENKEENKMDMVGASQQLTETGRRLKQYGTTLDEFLKFIRDSRNADKIQSFLKENGFCNGTMIFESPSKIKYLAHERGAAIIEENKVFFSDNQESYDLSESGMDSDSIFVLPKKGILILEDKSLRLNDEVLLRDKSGGFIDNTSCIVNPDGTFYFRMFYNHEVLADDAYIWQDHQWKSVPLPNILLSGNAPIAENKFGITWAAFHPSGKIVIYIIENYQQHHGWFYLGDKIVAEPFPGDAVSIGFIFGISNRGLVTNFDKQIQIDGQTVYESDWSEMKVCPEGFIVKEGEALKLNGGRIIHYGQIINWDVFPGGVVVQKKVGDNYELHQIKYQTTLWDKLTPFEWEKISNMSAKQIKVLLSF